MSALKAPKAPIPDWEQVRNRWVAIVTALVDQVEAWAREFGWATRRIDKRMEESKIGEYTVPGLLLQEGWAKVMLEPVARFLPGADGVVDLYLMPAYDDMASLYLHGDEWLIRRPGDRQEFGPGSPAVPPTTLTKASLETLFGEMTSRAA